MPEYANTQIEAAAKLGVTRSALVSWAGEADFPHKTKTRGWNLDKIRAWAKKHGRGEHRRGRGGQATTSTAGVTLAEANIRLTVEKAENERIKKERQLVAQELELRGIVLVDDVTKLYQQTKSTVAAVMDSLVDVVDRALPEKPPSAAAYKEVRKRVLAAVTKAPAHTAAAMEELE